MNKTTVPLMDLLCNVSKMNNKKKNVEQPKSEDILRIIERQISEDDTMNFDNLLEKMIQTTIMMMKYKRNEKKTMDDSCVNYNI